MKKLLSICMVLMIGSVVLTGCQAIQGSNAKSTEQLLAAAGFQMRLAQTPAQLASLQEMPQRKLVPHVKDGQNVYVYADAEFCQCVYVGGERNHQEYQKMAYRQNLADEQNDTAEMNSQNFGPPFAWGAWGPWGPWGPWE